MSVAQGHLSDPQVAYGWEISDDLTAFTFHQEGVVGMDERA